MSELLLRDATGDDAELVFGWRNDPWIIAKGSLNKKVSWEEHSKWFSSLIQDPACHMYIIEINGASAGQVRFIGEEGESRAEISIYLLQTFIGQGRGAKALKRACDDIVTKLNIKTVLAYILEGNEQSQNAFEKAGFVPMDKCDMNDQNIENKLNHRIYCLTL